MTNDPTHAGNGTADQPARRPGVRGRPFPKGVSGNPAGKPKGTRHKATQAVMALLDGEAEAITRKAIEAAKEGDLVAIKLVLDRIAPPRKDNPCPFQLPPLRTAADAPVAQAAIVEGVAAGDLTPGEAADLSKLVGEFVRAVEAADLAERIAALEAHQKGAAA